MLWLLLLCALAAAVTPECVPLDSLKSLAFEGSRIVCEGECKKHPALVVCGNQNANHTLAPDWFCVASKREGSYAYEFKVLRVDCDEDFVSPSTCRVHVKTVISPSGYLLLFIVFLMFFIMVAFIFCAPRRS